MRIPFVGEYWIEATYLYGKREPNGAGDAGLIALGAELIRDWTGAKPNGMRTGNARLVNWQLWLKLVYKFG